MLRLLVALLVAAPAWAEGERAGDFDYYVLSLSWSPSWCTIEGDDRDSDQCDPKHDYGFTLHGLWPQNEEGWPSFCRTSARDPSRAQTAAMADIMGTSGLAWYQWKKHGRCSGLSAEDYFDTARRAYESITRPEVFRKITEAVRLPPKVVEEAFLEDNDDLLGAGVTVTCRSGYLQEVRICLDKDLEPMICGRDIQQDCSAPSIEMPPIR
jgi:ribonuclease T2